MFNQGIAGDAVAPLLHVTKIIEGPIPGQTQFLESCQGINHRRCGALFVASTKAVDDAILELAFERVPLPLAGVGDTDRIEMAIVEQYAWAIANAPQDVAHGVAAHLVEA